MKFFDRFKKNYMESNLFLAVISAVIAVIVWLLIALTQYPSVQTTVYHIPVTVDMSNASQNGLNVISCDVQEVTAEILGSRTQIGYLTAENLVAYFDTDNVSNAGTKKLTLKIRNDNDMKVNYEIKSISPPTATVVFDKIEIREFSVTPLIPKVEIADGYEINNAEFTCDPSVIRITGPSAQLDKISKCCAVYSKEMTLSSTYILASDDIQLYTEDNAIIDKTGLKFSDMNFTINVPVRTHKTVGLSVSIVNAPVNFNKDTIKFKMSADTITLACNNSQTEIPDTIDIGVIPLNEIKPGFSRTFYMSNSLENSEYINVSDLESVTVTLEDMELAEKSLTIDGSRINISNIPDSSYEYAILTQQMDITIVGPEESISQITSEDIIADVSLLNLNITSNQFNQNVTFSCPTFDDVWVTTNAKVSVQRTKIDQPTTSAADLAADSETE
ncbi:MAG: hypothetical protein K2J37_05230 [Ruminococcus sp.]|nr:hypothetical protein [Ruminococcus sp.]MDE6784142.1 hypothetical protein [Ruminococcus sp.]